MTRPRARARVLLCGVVLVLVLTALPASASEIALFGEAQVFGCAYLFHPCVVGMQSRAPVPGVSPGSTAYIRYRDVSGFSLSGLAVSADFVWHDGEYAWGSPRFDIATDNWDHYIYAYWGDNGTVPAAGWHTMSLSSIAFVDYNDGTYHYNRPWAEAVAAMSGVTFTKAYVSLDGGGAGTDQRMWVDNFTVNGSTYSPECAPVADPGSSLLLLGIGLAGLRAWRKR
jgi:hypothetical protein